MATSLGGTGRSGSNLLDAMLRATFNASGQINEIDLENAAGTVALRAKTSLTSANWAAPSGGNVYMTGYPIATIHITTGTIATANMGGPVGGNMAGLFTAGLSGTDVAVDNTNISSGASTCNITGFGLHLPNSVGTVTINDSLRDQILKYLTKQISAHFSGSGTIKVYTGSAPGANNAVTGTQLLSFATTSATWSSPSSSSSATNCALASTLTATAGASGTAGYARLEWTDGTNTYRIEGSIGTSAKDFIISSTTIVSGNSFSLTAADIGW